MVTLVPGEELTLVEQSLVEHVDRGEWLDLADDEALDEAAMRIIGDSRTCWAAVIATSCVGDSPPTLIHEGCGFGELGSLADLIWQTSRRMSASS